jgi:hypothetical protein
LGARASGLLGAMSTDTFIKKHKPDIMNIDGNLDTAVITLRLKDGRLAFYWFDEGKYIKHTIKE